MLLLCKGNTLRKRLSLFYLLYHLTDMTRRRSAATSHKLRALLHNLRHQSCEFFRIHVIVNFPVTLFGKSRIGLYNNRNGSHLQYQEPAASAPGPCHS